MKVHNLPSTGGIEKGESQQSKKEGREEPCWYSMKKGEK